MLQINKCWKYLININIYRIHSNNNLYHNKIYRILQYVLNEKWLFIFNFIHYMLIIYINIINIQLIYSQLTLYYNCKIIKILKRSALSVLQESPTWILFWAWSALTSQFGIGCGVWLIVWPNQSFWYFNLGW